MRDASNGFARFMAKPAGRLLRVAAGLALIAWGWSQRGEATGIILMSIGLVPLLAGAINFCLIAPIIGAPFSGRAALDAEKNALSRDA